VIHKNVFIIFCQGEQLRSKVRKICEAFGAKLYPCPETAENRRELSQQVAQRVSDLNSVTSSFQNQSLFLKVVFKIVFFPLLVPLKVLSKTTDHRKRLLSGVAEKIGLWEINIKKEKAIYHTMNCFNVDVTSKCFIAEGWCPSVDIPQIREALNVATQKTETVVPSVLNVIKTRMEPPTFNRTNKFTNGFQVIIDAYGVGKYREVNPAPFSIITFPFLFAVMFGDFGHGILMALIAYYIIWNEKKLEKQKNGEVFFFFSFLFFFLYKSINTLPCLL